MCGEEASARIVYLRALLRAGVDLLKLRRHLFEDERQWIERALDALAEDEPASSVSWHYVGCNCGATVREFSDGRYNADGSPHQCRATIDQAQRQAARAAAIERAVEELLQRAYEEARASCGTFWWEEFRVG